jgi:catechol 2,3-dioxygenase-like lactoylglutathione lyase family enzyme
MNGRKAEKSWLVNNLGAVIAAAAAVIALGSMALARTTARAAGSPDTGNPMVMGMAFDGHQTANLDATVKFYVTMGYPVASRTDWKVDKVANALGGTKGAESRTAIINIPSSVVADKPFPLILREYRGIDRKDWSTLTSSDLGAGHIDVTVMDDCNPVMDTLKAAGLLRLPKMGFPEPAAGQPRPFVFVQDPDGWFVELFAKMKPAPGAPPAEPKVSNSSATARNIERLGIQAGFNHIGLNVIDATKALAFYQGVLGGDYPPLPPPPPPGGRPAMGMMNGWFPQAGTDQNVRLELLANPGNKDKTAPDQHFADIGTNYVGFQVTDIDAMYAKVKAAGATTVSEGGIVKTPDGRAVVVKDPDVGGFVELWEAKK